MFSKLTIEQRERIIDLLMQDIGNWETDVVYNTLRDYHRRSLSGLRDDAIIEELESLGYILDEVLE